MVNELVNAHSARPAPLDRPRSLKLVPPGVVKVMFGSNSASNSTASHITLIASDAHIP